MKAADTDIVFVEYRPKYHCPEGTTVFRSVLDILCRGLFKDMPQGINPEEQIPNIRVWEDGVEPEGNVGDGAPYTFIISGEEAPRKSDVIFYNGRLYVIGDVHTVDDPYLEIEPDVIWVYPDWAADNDVYSNTRWNIN